MNNNETELNNSDTDFLMWEKRRKPSKATGTWAKAIQPDPFLLPSTEKAPF